VASDSPCHCAVFAKLKYCPHFAPSISGMKKILATCLLLAVLAPSNIASEPECRYGVIISGSDRYCAPPPDDGGLAAEDGNEDAESDENTYLTVLLDSAWVVLSLL